MNPLLHLDGILSDFRFMFNSQNFALFQAFIYGFITHTGSGTLTQLYQSSASQTRYLTKLIFAMPHPTQKPINVKTVCEALGIHWYQPKKLTQALRVAYLQSQIREKLFSTSSPENTNSQNITPVFQQDTMLPFDKAA